MLIRDCAGGVVFCGEQVLILQNDKGEWIFPKGAIRGADAADDVAAWRVQDEAGVRARIIAQVGRTAYEFFSRSRQKPVANRVIWYLMLADETEVKPNQEQGFQDGGFFDFEEARERISYSQDRALLEEAYGNYLAILDEEEVAPVEDEYSVL